MNQHSSVPFLFGDPKKSLSISNPTSCSLSSALVSMPSLFSNLKEESEVPITSLLKLGLKKYFEKKRLKDAQPLGELKF